MLPRRTFHPPADAKPEINSACCPLRPDKPRFNLRISLQKTLLNPHLLRMKHEENSAIDGRKPTARSRLTNGNTLHLNFVDGRSAEARRLHDLIADHTSDLGGEDHISEAERRLIRRAAILTLECERLEYKWAAADGATVRELELYQRTSNSLRRLLESLGLQRRQRDVTPSPLEYAKRVNGEAVS
jgi:hypothetical protein